ncbi:MAG: nicotinate phosphoribosyltransferase [Deltaproteobacteria bacterium]|nr:nicotinate phosphoribosyltransferase [Deltaproteobacteria bacterium]
MVGACPDEEGGSPVRERDRSLAEGILYTDQYQLTMAQLYYRMGLSRTRAQFEHFFRRCPDYGDHQAGYCVNAGLEWALDWMAEARFRPEDLSPLRGQRGRTGAPVFAEDFLDWLSREGTFEGLSIAAIPEGRVVHPNVPLTVVQGPLPMAQLLETALLNHLNYQTLIATKAARIHASGRGRLLLEFGLRRAQERGGSAGVRAALIGGADFSSAVGISHVLGLAPKGTHAHSMVQVFMAVGEGELGAFRAYAEVYPDDCLLLVDTINTLESGVPNAIRVFEELRRKGHAPVGIRLDSGDLAHLAVRSAKMLDEAGFPDTTIVLSNNLDELVLWQILAQIEEEAPRYGVDAERLLGRLAYGVGTRLITSRGQAALDGVYKLVAVERSGEWVPAIKISEAAEKTLNPGHKRVWRLYDRRGKATADVLGLDEEDLSRMAEISLHHPVDHGRHRVLSRDAVAERESLLEEVMRDGTLLRPHPTLEEIRDRRRRDLERLDPGVKRLVNPHVYHVSLTDGLWRRKQEMIEATINRV